MSDITTAHLVLAFIGSGYLIGISVFGPAIFTAIIKDIVKKDKIARSVARILTIIQFLVALGAYLFVFPFLEKLSDIYAEQSQHLNLYMFISFFIGMVLVFLCLHYLNRVFAATDDHK